MASQKQVTDVFSSLWSETGTYEEDGIDSYVKRHQDWSDGKIGNWITLALQCDNPANDKINILDAGCGLGISFANILSTASLKEKINLNYTGLDLIDLSKTRIFIKNELLKEKYKVSNLEIELINEDMRSYCENNQETKDLVIAFGSLHHTEDLKKSIISTFEVLKPSNNEKSGYYIGWIINSQKPLRARTDKFFREYFNNFSSVEACSEELETLAIIFEKLSLTLNDEKVTIPKNSKLLDLKAGQYKLQTLLYDYFLKCYYRSEESERRQLHQLFDWFSPDYYHQTTRYELEEIISELNFDNRECEILDIVSKENGHYFFLRKHVLDN